MIIEDDVPLTPEQVAAMEAEPCCMGVAVWGVHHCTGS